MTRSPRLTGKELGKVLERAGWTLDRTTGSHFIYVKPGSRLTLSVPANPCGSPLRSHLAVEPLLAALTAEPTVYPGYVKKLRKTGDPRAPKTVNGQDVHQIVAKAAGELATIYAELAETVQSPTTYGIATPHNVTVLETVATSPAVKKYTSPDGCVGCPWPY